MSKLAFVFPGQGSQYIGMGRDFYDNVPESKAAFETAADASGVDIPKLIFEENEDINKTEFTQIAVMATEVALLEALKAEGVEAAFSAGHSLGEYSAITAAGAIEMYDAFKLIRLRGIAMQEAYPTGGAMSAVLGAEVSDIEEACEKAEGIVSVANYNCPGQIVITGEEKAVAQASKILAGKGVKKIVPLKVSGPFHSELMSGAADKLKAALEEVKVSEPKIPYIANFTASPVTKAEDIKPLLIKQLTGSVRWTESVEYLRSEGVSAFVEIGPGKTLAGFNKRIDRELKTINIEKYEDFKEKLEAIRGIG
ncbi:MAG: ACP S-malonyltransferase [Lachnospiraceae bacterium]|nr:ACP S-malonyltransferase [Lachnospiraceae bacterium]